jgi:hypothetical protein
MCSHLLFRFVRLLANATPAKSTTQTDLECLESLHLGDSNGNNIQVFFERNKKQELALDASGRIIKSTKLFKRKERLRVPRRDCPNGMIYRSNHLFRRRLFIIVMRHYAQSGSCWASQRR